MITGRELSAHNARMAEIAAHEANLAATPRALLPFVGKSGGVPFPFNQLMPGLGGGLDKIQQPFAQSVWVSRAIGMISGEIASIELEFYDAAEEEVQDPAIDEFWSAPAIGADKKRIELDDVVEILTTWRKLEGEFFLILDDSWLLTFTEKRSPFIIARPDRMFAIVRQGELVGWEFQTGAGRRIQLLPEQVIHSKRVNPYDPFRGLSEWRAAEIAGEADYLAGKFNLNLMRNNGDQGVYVIAKGGMPTDPQREQITRDLRMKRELSQRGQFRPLFLAGDITIEDAKMQVPDAAFVSVRLENRHEIFIAFGVPPSMADVKAAYSIGSDSDRHTLVTGTCVPVSKKIAGSFRQLAAKQNPRITSASFDWDEHPVMQAVRRERVDTAVKLWGTGMPMDQVSDYLSLGLPAFPGSDVGYLPFSVAPIAADGTPAKDPATSTDYSENDADGPVGAMMRALVRRRFGLDAKKCEKIAPLTIEAPDDLRIFFCTCHGAPFIAKDAAGVARWRDYMGKRRQTLKEYESRINRELMGARGETLSKIERLYKCVGKGVMKLDPIDGKPVARAAAADLVFDKHKFKEGLFASLRKQARISLDTAGKQLLEEIGRDDPFSFPPEAVLQFARERENKLANVPEEIHEKIKEVMEEGLVAGDSTEELADRVRDAFNGISKGRARVIASTETSAAYGPGRHKAMRAVGIKRKAWLTSGNANVRPAHEAAGEDYDQEHAIPIDEPYIVDGEELMYPGDSSGSAENVINCHCISIAVQDSEEDGK